MPNGQRPPMGQAVQGLQAAGTGPDQLINERLGVNRAMSGGGPQMAPAKPPAAPQGIQLNPGIPDPSGMLAALKQAGYTGQRTGDIQLPDEPQSVDELTRRVDALLKGR